MNDPTNDWEKEMRDAFKPLQRRLAITDLWLGLLTGIVAANLVCHLF